MWAEKRDHQHQTTVKLLLSPLWTSRQSLYFYCKTSGFKFFIPHGQSEMCMIHMIMKHWWGQRESACKPARCAGTMQFTNYHPLLLSHFSCGIFLLQNNLSYLWIWKLRNWGKSMVVLKKAAQFSSEWKKFIPKVFGMQCCLGHCGTMCKWSHSYYQSSAESS